MIKDDAYYLKKCLQEAKKAYEEDEVPVGSVIVLDGKVIAKAHNKREQKKSSISHAEVEAISKACKKLGVKFLDGATIYITLEPCLMCLGAILQARIKRVVFSCPEPKFGSLISCPMILDNYKSNHMVEYKLGDYTEEVKKLMNSFFKEKRSK